MCERRSYSSARNNFVFGVIMLLTLASCGGGGGGSTTTPPVVDVIQQLRATCSAIKGQTVLGASVTDAIRYEVDGSIVSNGFCSVKAARAPYLDMEILVPDNWSGRVWQVGGGGTDGGMDSALEKDVAGKLTGLNIVVSKHRAIYAASNGGNRIGVLGQEAPQTWFDGTAAGKQSANDYAYAAISLTHKLAFEMANRFYSKAPTRSYFHGCSNGGRNAYTMAERYPSEFDGIVAGCEGMDISGQTMAWMNMAKLAGTPTMPSDAQWKSVYQAAVASCDAADGLADGMIANYSQCNFDVASLHCGVVATANCLTPAQVTTVKQLMGELKAADDTTLFAGFNWADWLVSSYANPGGVYMALALDDGAWLAPSSKIAQFDVNLFYQKVLTGLKQNGVENDKTAIANYLSSGKKMIHWHDGADGLLSVTDHARNIKLMEDIAKQKGVSEPSAVSRFFVVPGTAHGGGWGWRKVDWSDAIINWVESGVAPSQLTFNTVNATGAAKTLPVCQYPNYPRYSGSGDVNVASNYRCTRPN